jgi:hypothetical protein
MKKRVWYLFLTRFRLLQYTPLPLQYGVSEGNYLQITEIRDQGSEIREHGIENQGSDASGEGGGFLSAGVKNRLFFGSKSVILALKSLILVRKTGKCRPCRRLEKSPLAG